MFNRKRRTSLSEQAYQKIRNLIISLHLKPGSQLNECDLGRELSIGRTPVREALLRLVAERFLTSVPGRGFFVHEVTIGDVKALFEAIIILGRATVALAARRIDPKSLMQLEKINRNLKTAMSQREFLQITLFNSKFHRTINKASSNDFLISSIHNLESQYHRLAYLCFSEETETNDLTEHFAKVIADHAQLLECLKKRDEQGAVETMTRHIFLFHARVSKYFYPPMQALDTAHGPYYMNAERRSAII